MKSHEIWQGLCELTRGELNLLTLVLNPGGTGASPAALRARAGAQPPPEKGGELGTEVGAAMAKMESQDEVAKIWIKMWFNMLLNYLKWIKMWFNMLLNYLKWINIGVEWGKKWGI
jgi:hypothetical protein